MPSSRSRWCALALLLFVTASLRAEEATLRTFGGGFSTRWKTHGPHGHDQTDPCQQRPVIHEFRNGSYMVDGGSAACDYADFLRGNLDDSIGYRFGIERDFAKAGIFRFVGAADASISSTEYNISQVDLMVFGGAVSSGIDVSRWGARLGMRFGLGGYVTDSRMPNGMQTFREVVASVPLRSGASLRIARRSVGNRLGADVEAFQQDAIDVVETSVMFVASPDVRPSKWEFETSSGTSLPGGLGGNLLLKPAGWHRLTVSRELPWSGLEARATWTAFAHESRVATDFRGFPGNERSKTVDSFGLGAWRAQRLGSMFSLHYGAGVEVADWRDEHHLLLDRQLRDVIGGVETALVAGGALRMRVGRGTALEAHVEEAHWTHLGLGETRWGIGLVLTR